VYHTSADLPTGTQVSFFGHVSILLDLLLNFDALAVAVGGLERAVPRSTLLSRADARHGKPETCCCNVNVRFRDSFRNLLTKPFEIMKSFWKAPGTSDASKTQLMLTGTSHSSSYEVVLDSSGNLRISKGWLVRWGRDCNWLD
jgi:hypothetical protein